MLKQVKRVVIIGITLVVGGGLLGCGDKNTSRYDQHWALYQSFCKAVNACAAKANVEQMDCSNVKSALPPKCLDEDFKKFESIFRCNITNAKTCAETQKCQEFDMVTVSPACTNAVSNNDWSKPGQASGGTPAGPWAWNEKTLWPVKQTCDKVFACGGVQPTNDTLKGCMNNLIAGYNNIPKQCTTGEAVNFMNCGVSGVDCSSPNYLNTVSIEACLQQQVNKFSEACKNAIAKAANQQ